VAGKNKRSLQADPAMAGALNKYTRMIVKTHMVKDAIFWHTVARYHETMKTFVGALGSNTQESRSPRPLTIRIEKMMAPCCKR